MNLIRVSDVKVIDRGRKEFKGIPELADSIKRHGLIHPIVLEKRKDGLFYLIAGERRLRAHVYAGLETIQYTTRADLTDIERRELELEENIQRSDLSFVERCEMQAAIDEIKKQIHGIEMRGVDAENQIGGWSGKKTAEALGVSNATISQAKKIADFVKKRPETRESFQKLPKAAILRKMDQIEANEKAQRLLSMGKLEVKEDFKQMDALAYLKTLDDNSVDLVLTDPPYAAEAVDDAIEEVSQKHTLFQSMDNLNWFELKGLIERCLQEYARVLKPGRHGYIFCDLTRWIMLQSLINNAGLKCCRMPIIWDKAAPMTPFTGLSWSRSYEAILFFIKPGPNMRNLKSSCRDVIRFSPADVRTRVHACEKPIELLQYLMELSSEMGDNVLDTFAGSGSTLIAARSLHRTGLGCELSKTHYASACERLSTFKLDDLLSKPTIKE